MGENLALLKKMKVLTIPIYKEVKTMLCNLGKGKMRRMAIIMCVAMIVSLLQPSTLVHAEEGGGSTTTWNFRGGEEGAYSGNVTGTTGEFNGIVINASAEGSACVVDVGTTLVSEGTTLSVPVSGSAILLVKTSPASNNYTINGVAATSADFSYTYEGSEGFVPIVATGTVSLLEISSTPYVAPPIDDDSDTVTGGAIDVDPVTGGAIDFEKIDVWDFGAEQLDSARYNNKLSADNINSMYPGIASGTKGPAIPAAGFNFNDGELLFITAGKTNHRLRTMNTAITRYDEKSLPRVDGLTTYTGYIYSNVSATNTVYLGVKLYKNDIMRIVVGSNGGASTINFESPSGAIVQKRYTTTGKGAEMTFYAKEEGTYKVYSSDEKLVVARVYRQHTRPVTVSGNVTAPAELAGYGISFTNKQTGEITTAPVTAGSYSTTLNEKYEYEVGLFNANGYIITGSESLAIAEGAGNQTFNATVIQVDLVTLTGNITGLSLEALAKLDLDFESEKIYVPVLTISESGNYTLKLERNVTYTVVAEGVNDYSLTGEATITVPESGTHDFVFEEKTKYPVAIIITGIDEATKGKTDITFTNIHEEGYSYAFDLNSESIALRNGQYQVKVSGAGESAVALGLTPDIKVNGAATSAAVNFKPVTDWNFAAYNKPQGNGIETISGLSYYMGLNLSNIGVAENKTYLLLSSGGTVDVPVKAGDILTLNYCYSAAFQFNGDEATRIDEKSGSTSQIDTRTYTATTDGYVRIEGITGTNNQTYITRITVTTPIPYDAEITVGASGCDYTSINAALAAVKRMSRTNEQRVTIAIQPGNYEEMLVIDVPNVSLKNASTTPSIELTNKGVNIAPGAVRVTSYYGHGYAYYSMGSDCKYNEDLLAVNRTNGYLTFNNPGTGTTSGSYWNATVVVYADGFEADGIIFENSYNQYISQREANDLVVPIAGNKGDRPKTAGDTSVQNRSFVERAAALAIADNVKEVYFNGCRFVGRQDTLYGGKDTVAAFNKCAIMGACDFIFGGMTAVFYKCDLVMNTSEDSSDIAYLTAAQQAAGRGYLMYNCTVTSTTPGIDTASAKKSKPGYFGRPWQPGTSEVVFYKTIVEATDYSGDLASMILPAGWLNSLSGESQNMCEYGTMECLNGVNNSAKRAPWSTVLTEAKLLDNTDISTADKAVTAFLGSWKPFILDASDDTAVIVTPEPTDPPVTVTKTLNANDLTIGSYTNPIDSNGFMIMANSANKVDIDANGKSADEFTFTQRIKLGGVGTVDYRSIKFTTTSAATLKVYALSSSSGADRRLALYNASGAEIGSAPAPGSGLQGNSINIAAAGDYYLASPESGVNVYGLVLTMEGSAEEPVREDWNKVAAPSITNVVAEGTKITVTFHLVTGDDGADKATVLMLDSSNNVVDEALVSRDASKTSRTVEFTLEASGSYRFKVIAEREEEVTKKESALSNAVAFVLPLTAPVLKSATSKGNGSVEIEWNAVPEAESYVVSYKADSASEYSAGPTVTTMKALVTGLTIGANYTFRVKAVRGTDESVTSEIQATATAQAQRTWAFAAFGQGINTTSNYYSGNANEGSVTVASEGGRGKLVPANTDGLAFYYTTIDPDTENFILSANVTVDAWTYSNGQEGFGLMAADAVGTHGDSSVFWNNSYMNSVTKVEYLWNAQEQKVSDTGDKITMKLGVGAQEKTGVTSELISSGALNSSEGINTYFKNSMATLETTCANKGANTYNIVGNYQNADAPTGTLPANELQTTFKLTIQRDNTGYRLSYTDGAGNTMTKLFYDIERDNLTGIDKDNIYVGFFASRNAKITVTDIELKTSDPATDPPAEGRETTYVTPSYNVISTSTIGVPDYELVFVANADGKVTIKDSTNKVVVDQADVIADTYFKRMVRLTSGVNNFVVEFTPDPEFKFSEYEYLSSYETARFNHSVTYRYYDRNVIYVAPNGVSGGAGTKSSPLDIYTAVKYARPGQMIVLSGGTYSLNSTVTIPRGVNGTADHMIYLIADPTSATRPVFDFNRACAGMIFAGDYWYIQGFDVTKSADVQKGIQLSGDHCIVDQVNTYYNGNTGLQISRYLGTDGYEDWPSYNLVLNCTSYANADRGYEDADGFAAKLTVGDGNVFDGCIAYNNADDGWDLFAKPESGPIGQVVIRNCVTYGNGYLPDGTNAGNGNGFKMGGSSIAGDHKLINSIAYDNKAKGIDSNSGPNIQVYNSITFNNGSYNVAFYTNDAANTDFYAEGIISFRTDNKTMSEELKAKGTQDSSKINKNSNYFWNTTSQTSKNLAGNEVAENWFVNLDTDTVITRNADGTINMNGLLGLTELAPADAGARMSGAASRTFTIPLEPVDNTPTPVVTPAPVDEKPEPVIDADLNLTLPKNKNGDVDWNESIADILELFEEEDEEEADDEEDAKSSEPITVAVNMNGSTQVPKELLESIQGKNVKVTLNLGNGISWMIQGKDVTEENLKDVDLAVRLNTKAVAEAVIGKLFQDGQSSASSSQLSLVHEGNFGFKAQLTINVGEMLKALQEELKEEDRLDKDNLVASLYYYNPVTDALELQSSSLVGEDGNVVFRFSHASDYVILYSNELILDQSLLDQVTVLDRKVGQNAKETLYIGGTTGKTLNLNINVPEAILEAAEKGLIDFKVTNTSSNSKVALALNNGMVTGLRAGTATITTRIEVGDKVLEYTTEVTVKKAYVEFVAAKSELKKGSKVTFKVEVYGYLEEDIEWGTNKKGIATVGANKGKTTAVVSCNSAGKEDLFVKVKKGKNSYLYVKTKITVK